MEVINDIMKDLKSLKIHHIELYDCAGKSILADNFIVATADSTTQIEAARGRLIESMWKYKIPLKNPMEDWHGGWCLLDFGNTIVHIFLEEARSFYDIDSLLKGSDLDLSSIAPLRHKMELLQD